MDSKAPAVKPMAKLQMDGSNKALGLATVPVETSATSTPEANSGTAGSQGTSPLSPDAAAKETKPFVLPSVSGTPGKGEMK